MATKEFRSYTPGTPNVVEVRGSGDVLADMHAHLLRTLASKATARAFLIRAGIMTKGGKLAAGFRATAP